MVILQSCLYQRAELDDALMVIAEGLDLSIIFEGFLLVAHAVVAKGEHVLAVRFEFPFTA